MVRHVAVPVGGAFPDAHGGEVRRLQRRHVPLVDAVVGDAVEADLAVRPGLHAGPFDAVVEVLGLARREMIDEAGRAAGAAGIDAHAGIVVRHPLLGVDHLPVLVAVARAGGDVGMLLGHALPGARIAVLEGEALGVGPVGQDHRIAAVLHRAEDVGAQHQAVVHGDRHIPVDAHAVADFAAVLMALGRFRARRIDRGHGVLPIWCPISRLSRPRRWASKDRSIKRRLRRVLDRPLSRAMTPVGFVRAGYYDRSTPTTISAKPTPCLKSQGEVP